MTTEEFNKKYENYLEKGHYGLAINDKEVIDYLDFVFQDLIKIEGFSYSQIKTKFGMARVYMEPSSIGTYQLEEDINNILKREKL